MMPAHATTAFAKRPGGPNPLTEDECQFFRDTFGQDCAALFKAGLNTRKIAQITGLSEAQIYNGGFHRVAS